MSNPSEIIIAIGGLPAEIRRYVDAMAALPMTDEAELLSLFKIIEVRKDFLIYLFHQSEYCWCEEEQGFWQKLRGHAIAAQLAYLFYRLGRRYEDVEIDEHHGNNERYIYRLCELITLHRRIVVDDKITAQYDD